MKITKPNKTYICVNCKTILNNPNPMECSECNCKTLAKTDGSNYKYAKGFDKNDFRSYYNFPLKMFEGMDKVFSVGNQSAFDFELSIKNNPRMSMTIGTKNRIVAILNKPEHKPERDLNLIYNQESGTILMDGKAFLVIRGWGALTSDNYSANCYGLSWQEAKHIQDQFAEFILSRLTTKITIE